MPQWGQTLCFLPFILLISSRNPAVMIPAGSASRASPHNAIIPVKALPMIVIGTISPYPTDVMVTMDHQMLAGILENTFGCAACSAKYNRQEAMMIKNRSNTRLSFNSFALVLKTFFTILADFMYAVNLNNLKKRSNRRIRNTLRSN